MTSRIPPELGSKVTTRTIDVGAQVRKIWGENWAKPDIAYRESNGRTFDCTDLYHGGIYARTSITVESFSFTAVTLQQKSAAITSNSVTPTGVNISLPISVSGGQYSINGGSFTSSAGTWNPGDSVRVRGTSSSSDDTTTAVTLTIGSTPGAFSITTGDGTPVQFTFTDKTGQDLSQNITSNTVQITGITIPTAISVSGSAGAQYSINGDSFTSTPGVVNNNDNVQARVTSSASEGAATTATVTVGGVSDTFSVTTSTLYTEISADSPFHWWKLDEASGTSAADSGSNVKTGTHINTPDVGSAAIVNRGLCVGYKTASQERTNLPTNTLSAMNGCTVATYEWFLQVGTFPSGATAMMITCHDNGNASARGALALFLTGTNGNQVQLTTRSNNSTEAAKNSTPYTHGWSVNQTHHVAAIVDYTNDTIEIYIDGVRVVNDSVAAYASNTLALAAATVNDIGAGRTGGGSVVDNWFTGKIQSYAMYNTRLTGARIVAHYNASLSA